MSTLSTQEKIQELLDKEKKMLEMGGEKAVAKHKSKGKDFYFDIDDRVSLIRELRVVDEVVIYERVDRIVERLDFDVFCFGPDQNHEFFERAKAHCAARGIRRVLLERTPGISSSAIGDFIERQREHLSRGGRHYS